MSEDQCEVLWAGRLGWGGISICRGAQSWLVFSYRRWSKAKQKATMTPSLGPATLLEQLTELREIYQFVTKGHNSGAQGEVWGEGQHVHALSKLTSLPESLCVHQPENSTPCSFGVLWRLCFTGMIH